mmetsp:Transcript_13552/g.22321  ORF Transcript_13552/g.22321 Transcript_13552/m.22321 type:complete len:181 (+) Transcript_13552:4140-4682(+)
MAAILGLDDTTVEEMVADLDLPDDLWIGNFNCPGQVVVSGTAEGIAMASAEAKRRKAKRVLKLEVQGAFHSGLMNPASEGLKAVIEKTHITDPPRTELVMNVPGSIIKSSEDVRRNLILQLTNPVRWSKCIKTIEEQGVSAYIEVGTGDVLTALNRKLNVKAETISLDSVSALDKLSQLK